MTVGIIRLQWRGLSGLPGMTVLAVGSAPSGDNPTNVDAEALSARFTAMLDVVNGQFPVNLEWVWDDVMERYNEITGDLEAVVTFNPPASLSGTGSGPYAAPTGAHVNWTTATITANRLLRGRTFLVPLVTSAYDTQGNLTSTTLNGLRTAVADYVTANEAPTSGFHVIWSRTHSAVGHVSGGQVPDQATVLTSRRDT